MIWRQIDPRSFFRARVRPPEEIPEADRTTSKQIARINELLNTIRSRCRDGKTISYIGEKGGEVYASVSERQEKKPPLGLVDRILELGVITMPEKKNNAEIRIGVLEKALKELEALGNSQIAFFLDRSGLRILIVNKTPEA